MRHFKQYVIFSAMACFMFTACKKTSDSNSPLFTTTADTLGATINGVVWTPFSHNFTAVSGGGVGFLEIGGTDSTGTNSINFTLNDYSDGPRSYAISASGMDSANHYYNSMTKYHATSGTVKIIAVTSTYIQGIFNFTSPGDTITNGVFNYKL